MTSAPVRTVKPAQYALKCFQENGYLTGRQLLLPQDIEQIKTQLNRHIDRLAGAYLEPFSHSLPDQPFENRIQAIAENQHFGYARSLLTAILSDSQNDPLIGDIILRQTIKPLVDQLLTGYQIIEHTTRVRARISAFPDVATGWHQDLADEDRPDGGCNMLKLTCWIPLSDVDEHSGALQCIPGHFPQSLMQRHETGYRFPQDVAEAASKKTLSCKQGDVVFLDRFLPHRSLPIQTGMSRWSIVTWIKAEKL